MDAYAKIAGGGMMLDKKELQDYYDQIRDANDKVEIFQIFQMIYRAGYVHGCNDSNNKVKE